MAGFAAVFFQIPDGFYEYAAISTALHLSEIVRKANCGEINSKSFLAFTYAVRLLHSFSELCRHLMPAISGAKLRITRTFKYLSARSYGKSDYSNFIQTSFPALNFHNFENHLYCE